MKQVGHTHARQGKKVIVWLREGAPVIARYGQHKDTHIEFLDHAPIPLKAIRTVAVYRAGWNR